ncbi:MAG: hypothetical protein IJD23_09795 [Spirochaetaceae bacterium]|nr:hypothetical protein [Spirochaetaceae bacterium]
MKTKLILLNIFAILLACILFGCASPSPFIGTWADNSGNTITFGLEGEFNASIKNASDDSISYTGTYTVLQNALYLESDALSIVTEWDIRGSMLYIEWTDADKFSQKLTLYKIKN